MATPKPITNDDLITLTLKLQHARAAAQSLIGDSEIIIPSDAESIKQEISTAISSESPSIQAKMSFFIPNPFSMLIDKIVGKYKGKLNDGIDEVLKNAEVKVSMSDGSSTGNFENTVDINIKVAASIIDEYTSILEFFIGDEKVVKQLTPTEIEKLHQAHEDMDKQLSKLKRHQLAINIDILEREMQLYKDKNIQPGCLSGIFGYYRKRIAQLQKPVTWLLEMSKDESVDEHVLATSIIIIKAQIKNIDNKDDRKELNQALNNILIKGAYPHTLEEIKNANAYFQDFANWSKENPPHPLKGYVLPIVNEEAITAIL